MELPGGAMKTQAGKSKMAKLAEAGPLSATSQAVVPIDPATMMYGSRFYILLRKNFGRDCEKHKNKYCRLW